MTRELRIGVGGMTCASCVARVERAIEALPGVIKATVNLSSESARVEYLPDTVSRERIARAIGEAGYEAKVGEEAPDAGKERRERALALLKRDLMFAAVLTAPLVLISMTPMFLPGAGSADAQPVADDRLALAGAPARHPGAAVGGAAIPGPGLGGASPSCAGNEQPGHDRQLRGLSLLPARVGPAGIVSGGHGQSLLRGRGGHRDPDPARPLPGVSRQGTHLGGHPPPGAPAAEGRHESFEKTPRWRSRSRLWLPETSSWSAPASAFRWTASWWTAPATWTSR